MRGGQDAAGTTPSVSPSNWMGTPTFISVDPRNSCGEAEGITGGAFLRFSLRGERRGRLRAPEIRVDLEGGKRTVQKLCDCISCWGLGDEIRKRKAIRSLFMGRMFSCTRKMPKLRLNTRIKKIRLLKNDEREAWSHPDDDTHTEREGGDRLHHHPGPCEVGGGYPSQWAPHTARHMAMGHGWGRTFPLRERMAPWLMVMMPNISGFCSTCAGAAGAGRPTSLGHGRALVWS